MSGNGTFVVLSFFSRRRRPCAEAALEACIAMPSKNVREGVRPTATVVRSRRSRYALGLLRTILLSKYLVGCFELSHSMHEILFQ